MTRKYLEANHIFNLYSTDNVRASLVFQSLFSFYTKKDKKKKNEQAHLINKHLGGIIYLLNDPIEPTGR